MPATATREYNKHVFVLGIGALSFIAITLTLMAATISYHWESHGWAPVVYLVVSLGVGIAATMIATKSKIPVVSLVSFMVSAIALGLFIGPIAAGTNKVNVLEALALTSAIVAVLSVAGAIFPSDLAGWKSYALTGSLAVLGLLFFGPVAGFFGISAGGTLTFFDWVMVLVISACIVFEWNRAIRLPRTPGNAVGAALNIYLGWLNLLLMLKGSK